MSANVSRKQMRDKQFEAITVIGDDAKTGQIARTFRRAGSRLERGNLKGAAIMLRTIRRARSVCAAFAPLTIFGACALAQTNTAAPGTAVTAALTPTGVRFAAPGSVVRMRLEVFSANGERVFASEFKGGNILDWATAPEPQAPSLGESA
jgi:hypothetical protein